MPASADPPARTVPDSATVRWVNRIVQGGLWLGAVGVIVLAVWLEPSSSGAGTHTELGFPPCGILVLTGTPCPSCGMTTSFSLAAELQPLAALWNQPMGFALFCATLAWVLWAPLLVWRGESAVDRLGEPWLRRLVILFVVGVFAGWAWKALVAPPAIP